MALNDGYLRFEGAAYFGYDIEGDGHEVVVIVGENSIEIRDFNDNVLSIWAAGAYKSNGQEPPMLAYFSGDEWLAPQDNELRETLDRFIAHDPKPEIEAKPNPVARILIPLLIVGAMLLLSFYLINFLSLRLLDDNIRRDFDQSIIAKLDNSQHYCNADASAQSREYIASIADVPEFEIRPNLLQNMMLMPSGTVLLDDNFVAALGSEQGVIAALQIAQAQSSALDVGHALLRETPITQKLRFLSNASLDENALLNGWAQVNAEASFGPELLRDIPEPQGDYNAIAASLPSWGGQNVDAEFVNIALSDQEWLNMISLCENES